MERTKGVQKQNENSEEAKKKQIDEFMTFEYFYNSLNKLDTDGVQVFSKIMDCLNKETVKFKELTAFIQSKRSIPDQARGVIWRILINYLPENRKQWINIIENNSKRYKDLVEEFILSRNKKKGDGPLQNNSSNADITNEEPIPPNISTTRSSIDYKQAPQSEDSNQQRMSKSSNLFDNVPSVTLKSPLMRGFGGTDSKKNLEIIEDCTDHPLNRKHTSSWNSHFKDLEIWEMIEKDTKRTRADFYLQKNDQIRLYNGQVAKITRKQNVISSSQKSTDTNQQNNLIPSAAKNPLLMSKADDKNDKKKVDSNNSNNGEIEEYRYDVITRILFLYYKITPEDAKVKYVQGMNEIIGLIYQCFSQETSQYLRENAESDAFFCFYIVMIKIKAMFNFQKNDDSATLTTANKSPSSKQLDSYKIYIDAFVELFKKVDLQLFNYLAQLNIDPKLYCLNWMIGFFCQNFDASRAMQVWDCLFISNDIVEFIPYICVSILFINRDELIVKQTSEIILKLQNISDINLDKLMKMAFNLYNEYAPKMNSNR